MTATRHCWIASRNSAARLVAIFDLGAQRGGDEVVVGREHRIELRWHRVLALRDLLRQRAIVGLGSGFVETLAGQQLVQHDAGGVDIGAMVDDAAANQLLRSHVAELAEAHLRIGRGATNRALRDAEVDDLRLALEGHEHVRRRDITVDEVDQRAVVAGTAMRVGEAVGELATDEQREIDRQALLAVTEEPESAAQVTTLDVLEREEVLVADPADLEDLRDVDVLQLDRDLCLVDEARDELLVGGEVRQAPS